MPYAALIHDCWTPGSFRRAIHRVAADTTWVCPKCGAEWVFEQEKTFYGHSETRWVRVVKTTAAPTKKQRKLFRR